MKKNYSKPQLSVVPVAAAAALLAGSNQPEERGDGLHWRRPNADDSFDEDEEVA